jgi:hypothetical protein
LNPDSVEELNLAKSYIHNVRCPLQKNLRFPKNLTLGQGVKRLIED